ncbi:MAG: TonB-dependent receptor [Acidobacteriia bacterium]|nr:TonB-dependent receptor [Terriglobia bacterium]
MSRRFYRFAVLSMAALPLLAQRQAGELRLRVVDSTGAGLTSSGELVGQATDVRQAFTTGIEGQQTLSALPFGIYRLRVSREGFQTATTLIEIRSEVPLTYKVTLVVAPIETTIDVQDTETLLNPDRTGASQQIGAETLRDRPSSAPARAIIDLVNAQPGWLLEANGVLHPRGSEYGVQYVLDGLPLLDNRSPNFAPALDIDEFQSLVVRTGGYPAEYGRQLGGVIEVNTTRDTRPGFHGTASMQGGSFGTGTGSLEAQYGFGKDTVGLSADAMTTDRYLDPPVLQNFTNHGSGAGVGGRWERNWGASDRSRVQVRRNRVGFLVPNEGLQQDAGQRQDRTAEETSGQASFTHLLSPRVLFDVRGSGRDVTAGLWSNPLSTPIAPAQNRRFREGYATAALSVNLGAHNLKFGADGVFRSIEEQFSYRLVEYQIQGIPIFDPDTPSSFQFANRRQNREQGVYAQDQIRFHSLTINAGLRWDHYALIVHEQAASPRLAASWQVPGTGLVLRASYDRAFQMPAVENLLLAGSGSLVALNDAALALPVRPSRGNFYEAGLAKSLFAHLRLDASYYRRDVRNFADDDLLLNTGISFPIAFNQAAIYGFEAKLGVLRWGRVSGFVSYSNMVGMGQLPIAGGLFLDDNSASLLQSHERFPISQDQRNSVRARFRYQVLPRLWVASAAAYGSGLPVELAGVGDAGLLAQQYGQAVLDRVNFDRGRVRPSFSLDFSAGAEVWKHEKRSVRIQADVANVTDRLNVINFAGLFSGTAVAAPRSAAVRLQVEF